MKVVTLVSAVEQNIEELARTMKLGSDSVITCQCDRDEKGEYEASFGKVIWERLSGRGVGVNRNTCIKNAVEGDILLFSDEDIVYDPNYAEAVAKEYETHPEAEGILFNVRVGEARRTYWNKDYKRVGYHNYGRYPAYSISVKREVLKKSGVLFPLEFGGGAKYINGEDSVFLHDLLEAGVRLYRSPVCLGEETVRESTWFKGYDDRFFISRGALYVRLYGRMAGFMGAVFLLRHPYMIEEIGFIKAFALMKRGIREIRGS